MRSLNALHYPSLVQRQKVFHHWWTSWAGLLLGSCVAWGWQHWQEIETTHLQLEQSRLQAALLQRTEQAKDAAWQQTRMRTQAEQAGQLRLISEHQQAWVALNNSLQQEAQVRGLRLSRLQVESDRVELQGSMTRFDALSDTQQSLSAQLPQALALTSLTVGPADELSFVWQATWPAAQGAKLTSPVRSLQPKP